MYQPENGVVGTNVIIRISWEPLNKIFHNNFGGEPDAISFKLHKSIFAMERPIANAGNRLA